MTYNKTNWVNNTNPAISAENLNKIENELERLDNQVEDLSADYIVEQGTSGIWTYRKWNSGIAECWGIHSWAITTWTAWGNLYESNITYVNYPNNLFIALPFVQIVPNCDTGAVGASGVEVWTGATAERTPQINLLRGNTGATNANAAVNIRAIGRWK